MQLSGNKSLDMPSVESSLRRCAEGSGNHSETHFSIIFRDFTKGVIHGSHFSPFFAHFSLHFLLIFTARDFYMAVKTKEKWIEKQLKNGRKTLL